MVGINKIIAVLSFIVIGFSMNAQITEGRIVFERKTNLKKKFGDNERMAQFITDENKIRIEQFEMYFDATRSVFLFLETDEAPAQGFMKYMTMHNKVYQDIAKREKFIAMDLWGNETYIKDTMPIKQWKVTESKRKIGGYMCRKAIWEKNDSTRIYAWFSVDVVPSVGPEGFDGLPGAILGLATEDGGLIYFAKEVEAMKVPEGKLDYDDSKKDVYTKQELREILEVKMGKWVKPKDLDEMFSWL